MSWGRGITQHKQLSEQETTDFDKCSEENKAKGDDWKASSDKMVSESITPESDISKETNMRKKEEAIKRFGKGCKTGEEHGQRP